MSTPPKETEPLLAKATPVPAVPVATVVSSVRNAGGGGMPVPMTMHRAGYVPETVSYHTELEDYLEPAAGLMIREKLFLSQVLCAACEKRTQFKVASWLPGTPDDADDTAFTARPAMFQVKEDSECCNRYCFHQFRELKLGVFPLGGSMHDTGERGGWPTDVSPILVMDKPCRCPVVLPFAPCFMFCKPEISVRRPASQRCPAEEYHGRVVFDWKLWNCCWPCTTYMDVEDAAGQTLYSLERPAACGAGCINCCAPSCCAKTHRTYIRKGGSGGPVVGEFLNIWPGWNVRGVCQGSSAADNFVIKFPQGATPVNKGLLMAGLFLHNFVFWESRTNQNSNK